MSIRYRFYLLVLSIFLLNACQNDDEVVPMDDDTVMNTEIIVDHQPDLFQGSFSGIIFDENLIPLSEVNIQISNQFVITDANGYFEFNGTLDANGTVLKHPKSII